ncbi:hypothetical protein [Pseudomonas asplenii]|uniref:hypothetical protein n=1 Tax=Pseudomonas asplenii TaxID=53407 RepID=UPI0037CBFCD2
MQLGFDRQHFTLPRVGIFLQLNKGRLFALIADRHIGAGSESYSISSVKGLVTDQFHLVRIRERLPAPGIAWHLLAPVCARNLSHAGHSVPAIVDMSGFINHVSS